MIEKLYSNHPVINIKIKGNIDLPVWSITHFIQQTSSCYIKLISLQSLCELISSGANNDKFYISSNSMDLFPEKEIEFSNSNNFIILENTTSKQEPFWKIFKNHERPIVFYKFNKIFYPLYNLNKDYSFRLKSLIIKSPPEIYLSGLGSILLDIFFGLKKDKREEIDWQNKQIYNSSKNIEQIVKTSNLINTKNIPEGIKSYANNMLDDLIGKQQKLNEKIGIEKKNIKIEI